MFRAIQSLLHFLVGGASSQFGDDNDSILAQLQEQGYFENFTEAEVAASEQTILKRGWDAIYDENPRFYWADAESLAECGVADFLAELLPFLRRINVAFEIADNWGDHDYTVTLNGKDRLIWNLDELRQEEQGRPGLTWGLSTVRTFELVNELLEAAQSEDRLYAINGGNDLAAVFLTPQLQALITTNSGFRKVDMPYTPVAGEDAWFGQPH